MAKGTGKAKSKSIVVEFVQERTTKNTVVYKEPADPPLIGSLYVQKPTAEELGNPEKIKVTVEAA